MPANLTPIARDLRKRSTDAERLLWRHLKARQLDGLKFRRQEQIGRFIVDFVCFEKALIIEADGGQHAMEIVPLSPAPLPQRGEGARQLLRFAAG